LTEFVQREEEIPRLLFVGRGNEVVKIDPTALKIEVPRWTSRTINAAVGFEIIFVKVLQFTFRRLRN
jgi:hypothetical protein